MSLIARLWRRVLRNHPIKANLNFKLKGCQKNKSSLRKIKTKNKVMNLQEDMHTNIKNIALSLT